MCRSLPQRAARWTLTTTSPASFARGMGRSKTATCSGPWMTTAFIVPSILGGGGYSVCVRGKGWERDSDQGCEEGWWVWGAANIYVRRWSHDLPSCPAHDSPDQLSALSVVAEHPGLTEVSWSPVRVWSTDHLAAHGSRGEMGMERDNTIHIRCGWVQGEIIHTNASCLRAGSRLENKGNKEK